MTLAPFRSFVLAALVALALGQTARGTVFRTIEEASLTVTIIPGQSQPGYGDSFIRDYDFHGMRPTGPGPGSGTITPAEPTPGDPDAAWLGDFVAEAFFDVVDGHVTFAGSYEDGPQHWSLYFGDELSGFGTFNITREIGDYQWEVYGTYKVFGPVSVPDESTTALLLVAGLSALGACRILPRHLRR